MISVLHLFDAKIQKNPDTPKNIGRIVGGLLHAPDLYGVSLPVVVALPDAVLPRLLTVTVEDDEVTFVHRAGGVHKLPGLFESLLNDFVQVSAPGRCAERDCHNKAFLG